MLLKPFVTYIPKFFNRDEKLIAFADKMDEIIDSTYQEIIDLSTFIDPVRMPSLILNDMGDYLNAGILNTDTERTKRQKISIAIQSHKLRGTWKYDVKPTIDSIIGDDAQLFGSSGDSSDFIVLGQESDDPDFYWGTIGIDGIDNELGLDVVGEGNELVLAGIFLIDVGIGDNSLEEKITSDGETKVTTDNEIKVVYTVDVEALKVALEDKIPDYFRVFLGYTDNSGDFIFFENGQIN